MQPLPPQKAAQQLGKRSLSPACAAMEKMQQFAHNFMAVFCQLSREAEGAGLHSGSAEEGTAAQQVCGPVLAKETLYHVWFPVETAAMEMSFQIMNSSGEVRVMGSCAAFF